MLTTNLKMPKVMWHQTDFFVHMNIHLVDVEKYYLRIDRSQLVFSTIVKGVKYCVILNLFGAIIPEESKTTNTGREVRIRLVKGLKGINWLRLHKEIEKNSMIQVDHDRVIKDCPKIKIPDTWKPGTLVQEYKKLNSVAFLRCDVPSSDEDAESDDEKYDTLFN